MRDQKSTAPKRPPSLSDKLFADTDALDQPEDMYVAENKQLLPLVPLPVEPAVPVVETPQASTVLGLAADAVYSHIDAKMSSEAYQKQLEGFISTHLPATDSDLSDPTSLINAFRSHFSSPSPPIPSKIFQTSSNVTDYQSMEETTRTWQAFNPQHNITVHVDARADEWVAERFSGFRTGRIREAGITAIWERLSEPRILRSDFWRYLVLATEGGTYADTDVECLHPIEVWDLNPSWERKA